MKPLNILKTYCCKIYFNTVFPYTPMSTKWPLPYSFSDNNSVCISDISRACTCLGLLIFFDKYVIIILKNISHELQFVLKHGLCQRRDVTDLNVNLNLSFMENKSYSGPIRTVMKFPLRPFDVDPVVQNAHHIRQVVQDTLHTSNE